MDTLNILIIRYRLSSFSDTSASLGGDLNLGGPNEKYYTGDFNYVTLTSKTYYKIKVDG